MRLDLTLPAALIEHLPFGCVQLGLPVKENAGEAVGSSTRIENFRMSNLTFGTIGSACTFRIHWDL